MDILHSDITIGRDDSSCYLSDLAIPSNALTWPVLAGLDILVYTPTIALRCKTHAVPLQRSKTYKCNNIYARF